MGRSRYHSGSAQGSEDIPQNEKVLIFSDRICIEHASISLIYNELGRIIAAKWKTIHRMHPESLNKSGDFKRYHDLRGITEPKTAPTIGDTNESKGRCTMTEKAQAVMNRLKLTRLFRPREDHRSTQIDIGPARGEQCGSKFLSELNSLVDAHEEFVKSLAPKLEVQ